MAKPIPKITIACTVAAVVWMAGVVAVAYYVPLYGGGTSSTFVAVNGQGSAWFVIAPFVATLVASYGILMLASGVRWLGAALTYPTICALGLYVFAAAFTIGPAIVPAAAMLVVATVSLSPRDDDDAS